MAVTRGNVRTAAEGGRLLVPIEVEALIVGKDGNATTWADVTPNYEIIAALYATLGAMLTPPVFHTGSAPPPGVHLHWALPDGLTHGQRGQAEARASIDAQGAVTEVLLTDRGSGYTSAPAVQLIGGGGTGAKAVAQIEPGGGVSAVRVVDGGSGYVAPPTVQIQPGGAIHYPAVPDRWLVLRLLSNPSAERISLRAWVVESNALIAPDNSPEHELGRLAADAGPLLAHGPIPDALRDALRSAGVDLPPGARVFPGEGPDEWVVLDETRRYTLRRDAQGWSVSASLSVSWPTLDNENTPYMYLGLSYDYEGGKPPKVTAYQKPLTALGPGDPSFAAFYPNCKSAFGFYDPLADLPGGGDLTYLVSGWYSDPSESPLARLDTPEAWASRMDELRWTWPGAPKPPDERPADLLCHGMVQGVGWKGPSVKYPSGVPQGQPEIAVGNSSIEALAALIASKLPGQSGIEDILEAFQYNLLDKLGHDDGVRELEQALHQEDFQSLQGGTFWEVQVRRSEDVDPAKNPVEPFDPTVGVLLSKLNDLQETCDRQGHDLRSLQWETYSAWYKKLLLNLSPFRESGPARFRTRLPGFAEAPGHIMRNRFAVPEPPPPAVRAVEGSAAPITIQQIIELLGQLEIRVQQARDALARSETQRDEARRLLLAAIAATMPSYELTESPSPRYWTADEPVVLLSGPGVERSFKHGEDGRLNDDERLPCRLPGQTVWGMTLSVTGHPDQTVTGEQLAAFYGKFPAGGPIPPEIMPLMVEALLLDTTAAGLIAVAALRLAGEVPPFNPQTLKDLTDAVRRIQTAPWTAALFARRRPRPARLDAARLAEAVGLNGTPPYKTAVAVWHQPWTPLQLEWSVQWFPSYKTPAEVAFCDPDDSGCGQKWIFGETDFAWNTKFSPVDGTPRTVYSGRTVLTPNAPTDLKARLKQYLQDEPESRYREQVTAILGQLGDLNLLSQSLGGFNFDMVMQADSLQLPVIDLFDPDVGDRVARAIAGQNQMAPQPDVTYCPVRAGHFTIIKLWVVDAFGQVQRVVDQGLSYNPVLSKGVQTPGGDQYKTVAQLAPRLAQPARLDFHWLMGDDDARPTNSDPDTSPVCGWLIPNYFDQSLMVYQRDGTPVGSLQMLAGGLGTGGYGVRWTNVPGRDTPLGTLPDIHGAHLNEHLYRFLDALIEYGAHGVPALAELQHAIYDSLSTINPTGSAAQDGNLAVLIGRPLAVVRASVALGLEGWPDYDQSWAALKELYDSGDFQDRGLTGIEFPLRLGDVRQVRDGTIGYVLDDDYSTFFSTLIEEPEPKSGRYVRYGELVRLTCDPAAPPRMLTLLVDPRAAVHLTSDILPTSRMLLPPFFIQDALAKMDVTFRVGPILNDDQQLALPLPSDIHGKWSWVYHPDVTTWREEKQIGKENDLADLPTAPRQINEGWLKLSDAFTSLSARNEAKR